MDTPTRTVIDALTGEVEIIPFTADEIAEREAWAIEEAKPKPELTVAQKLESVGLSVADLKVALGL